MIKARLDKHSIPEPNSGCILWCGATNRPEGGYGVLNVEGRTRYVHRLAWETENGAIPANMNVCHRCDVRLCINPAHMFLGAQAENMADMVAKGRQSRGARRPLAKLSADAVRDIRTASGTLAEIAERFGVSFQNVARIRAGQTWKHVEAA